MTFGVAWAGGGQLRQHEHTLGIGEKQLDVVVRCRAFEAFQLGAAKHDALHVRGQALAVQHLQLAEARGEVNQSVFVQ